METKNKILQRFSDCEIKVEQREDGEATRKITGYAAVFNKWSNPLGMDGWFREKIDARAFDNVLNDDVVAVFNHDNNIILARNKKTLNLLIDEIGLRYEFDAPKSPNGDNILAAVERGDIVGSSFRFIPKTTQWQPSDQDGIEEDRTITEISNLIDVGPVTFPAYPDSTASADMRDFEAAKNERKQPDQWQRKIKEQELKLYK